MYSAHDQLVLLLLSCGDVIHYDREHGVGVKLLTSWWPGRRKEEEKEEWGEKEEEEEKEKKRRGEKMYGHKCTLQKHAPVAQFLPLGTFSKLLLVSLFSTLIH